MNLLKIVISFLFLSQNLSLLPILFRCAFCIRTVDHAVSVFSSARYEKTAYLLFVIRRNSLPRNPSCFSSSFFLGRMLMWMSM